MYLMLDIFESDNPDKVLSSLGPFTHGGEAFEAGWRQIKRTCYDWRERKLSIDEYAKMALPDDLRKLGWSVAAHRDCIVDGVECTNWMMVKDGIAFVGEGRNDAIALNQIREQIESESEGGSE